MYDGFYENSNLWHTAVPGPALSQLEVNIQSVATTEQIRTGELNEEHISLRQKK